MRVERNVKTFAGLGSGVLILGCLLALALPLGRQAAKSPAPGSAAAAGARPGPDLDGDGRPDKVAITATQATVTAANGATLLEYSGKLRSDYTVLNLAGDHGPVPVLFLQSAENEYAAFTYDPSRGLLQNMTWPDGAAVGRGQLTATGDLVQPVLSGTIVRRRTTHLAVEKLSLKAASQALQPLKVSRKLPSEALAAAVQAAMFGLKDEMAIHFPDPDVARDFYARWHGKLPSAGTALVAQADDVDAGAEHGHLVPVTIWVSGDDGTAAGLKGEAEFVSGPTGVQILRINLAEQPLKVTSWSDAARRIKVKRPLAGKLERAEAPFYGRFRFTAGANRYAIDALTGAVEDE